MTVAEVTLQKANAKVERLGLKLEQAKRLLRSTEDVLTEAHEWMQAIPEATITARINNSLRAIRRFLND